MPAAPARVEVGADLEAVARRAAEWIADLARSSEGRFRFVDEQARPTR